MRRFLILLLITGVVELFAQDGRFIFVNKSDTVIRINNKAMRDFFQRNKRNIKSPIVTILADSLIFRKGFPIEWQNGYPVQFNEKGIEIKPKAPGAEIYNFKTKVITTANLSDNDGAWGKPVNPKPIEIKIISIEEPVVEINRVR